MKKGLAVFSGSAVVHKLMQDGTVVLGTAANPASVTVSGSLTASANSVEVGNVGGEFVNTTLGGILVELKNASTSGSSALSSSLKSYIDAQDSAEAASRQAGDQAVQANLDSVSGSLKTYIDGIDSAQTSARSALSSSMKAYVDAADASLQSAIDTEKARIDTILSGSDVNLDQFVEVVQFVNNLSGANYEALMDAVADINGDLAAVSGALAQEITDRETAVAGVQSNLDSVSGSLAAAIAAGDAAVQANLDSVSGSLASAIAAGDAAVQANLDSVSGSLAGIIQGNFDLQQSDIDGLRSDVDALTGDLSDETAARIAGDEGLQAQIDALTTASAGDTSALSSSLKAYVDGLDASQTSANDALSSSFASALDAEVLRATTAEALVQSNLDAASGSLAAAIAAEQSRAEAAEAGLQSAIDTEKGRIDVILSGSTVDLDTFKEVVDFVNSIDLTNDNALLAAVTDIGADISTLSGNLVSEIGRATAAEAGLQAQINSASFSVNGMSVDPFGGSFSIVSSSNIAVASAAGVVTVSLKDSVSIAGSLSAAQLSASAGLSVAGGATVAGGLTVSTGDMSVSQGAVSTRMTRVQAAARTAQDGDMFYLTDTTDDPTGTFPRGKAWYFRQDGEWFDAPFYMG
jgi:hypothetical protein